MGDPAGIGGEVTLLAWRDHHETLPPFCILDDPERLQRLVEITGIDCPLAKIADLQEAMAISRKASSSAATKLPNKSAARRR